MNEQEMISVNTSSLLPDITRINNLTYMEVCLADYSKQINDSVIKNFALGFENNSSLRYLIMTLSYDELSDESFKCLGQGIKALKNLLLLSLGFKMSLVLNAEKMFYLTEGIKALSSLSNLSLDLSNRNLCSKGIAYIAESIDALQNLKELNLDISFPARIAPPKVNGILSLLFIRKHSDQIGIDSFGPVFQRHKSLSSLSLNIESLAVSSEELESLASGIEGLRSLKTFKFHCNEAKKGDTLYLGMRSLYKSLRVLPKLEILVLKLGQVSYQDLENLFLHIQGLTKLKDLELDIERVESMSDQAAEYFQEAMKKLIALRSLILKISWSREIDIQMICRLVDGFKDLGYLTAFDCSFPGPRDSTRLQEYLNERSKYLRLLSRFVRYRCQCFQIPPRRLLGE